MTLGEMIERYRDKTGASYREIAERAQRAGYTLTTSSVHRLASTQSRTVPDTDTLHALAEALGERVETVALAAVASLGIELSPEVMNRSRARAWLALTEGRSDAEVAHLLRVSRTVADALDSAAGAAPPTSSAGPRGDDDRSRDPGEGPHQE